LAFAAVCNTLHAAFALATPAALRFAALRAELHALFGATTWPDTTSEQRNCNPIATVELGTFGSGCDAGFLLGTPRRGFSLSRGIAAGSGSEN